jgi:dephospho-CoA kinase
MTHPQRVLLGGGIGSGKSTAAAILADLGAEIISADAAGHRALLPGGGAHDAVAERWPGVVTEGRIDRPALGEIVFSDPEALAALEAITHPVIRADIEQRVAASGAAVVIVETALPREFLGPGWCWVVVDAPEAIRIERLRARGMGDDDIGRRISLQPGRREWLLRADLVICNAGDRDALAGECRRVWALLTGF